jgi:hypothetical protein
MMTTMILKVALAVLAPKPVVTFDANAPVESCQAAERAGVDLKECDDVQMTTGEE